MLKKLALALTTTTLSALPANAVTSDVPSDYTISGNTITIAPLRQTGSTLKTTCEAYQGPLIVMAGNYASLVRTNDNGTQEFYHLTEGLAVQINTSNNDRTMVTIATGPTTGTVYDCPSERGKITGKCTEFKTDQSVPATWHVVAQITNDVCFYSINKHADIFMNQGLSLEPDGPDIRKLRGDVIARLERGGIVILLPKDVADGTAFPRLAQQ